MLYRVNIKRTENHVAIAQTDLSKNNYLLYNYRDHVITMAKDDWLLQ